ncbi:hypothetical protein, partial [Legionella pneumophila]|uniref:hypothetical protein n=4 Tax=Legionella pneumophila TaxID=446 RepID=UPI0022B36FF1
IASSLRSSQRRSQKSYRTESFLYQIKITLVYLNRSGWWTAHSLIGSDFYWVDLSDQYLDTSPCQLALKTLCLY